MGSSGRLSRRGALGLRAIQEDPRGHAAAYAPAPRPELRGAGSRHSGNAAAQHHGPLVPAPQVLASRTSAASDLQLGILPVTTPLTRFGVSPFFPRHNNKEVSPPA